MPASFRIGKVVVGGRNPLFLIAGPCVIESRDLCMKVAEAVVEVTNDLKIPYIFKASYDKANRSSVKSFRGRGMEEGLRILEAVKATFEIPVLTDVHETRETEPVGEVVDVIQIPAFLCRQTDLLIAAAETGRPINIKKGQFMAPWEMRNAVEKVRSADHDEIMLTERGSCFGYNNLVVDFRAIPLMQKLGVPVVFDGSHSVQRPGGEGDSSGGESALAPYLVRAGVASGADGLFLEVHPNPSEALSDGQNSLALDRLRGVLETAISIRKAVASATDVQE